MMLTDKTKTTFLQAGIKPQNKIKVLLRSSKVHVAFFMTKAVFCGSFAEHREIHEIVDRCQIRDNGNRK